MSVFMEAVCGEDLAEDEEGGHGSVVWCRLSLFNGVGGNRVLVLEDNVVAAEGPAVVAGVEMVA